MPARYTLSAVIRQPSCSALRRELAWGGPARRSCLARLRQVARQVCDGSERAARFLAVGHAHAKTLLDRHRHLQRVERVEVEPGFGTEQRFVIAKAARRRLFFNGLEHHGLQAGDEFGGCGIGHDAGLRNKKTASKNMAAANSTSRTTCGRVSATPPSRNSTVSSASSPQFIGEISTSRCMKPGMTNFGTMMPPAAAMSTLTIGPMVAACAWLRTAQASASDRLTAARLTAASATTRAPQSIPASESASPPIRGISQMPAASINTACSALTPR